MKRLCYHLEELGSCYRWIINIESAWNLSYCDRVLRQLRQCKNRRLISTVKAQQRSFQKFKNLICPNFYFKTACNKKVEGKPWHTFFSLKWYKRTFDKDDGVVVLHLTGHTLVFHLQTEEYDSKRKYWLVVSKEHMTW